MFVVGFIQPAFVERMVLSDDPAGFVDRQLFDFPPERDMYLDVPVPDDVPELENILMVYYTIPWTYVNRVHLRCMLETVLAMAAALDLLLIGCDAESQDGKGVNPGRSSL